MLLPVTFLLYSLVHSMDKLSALIPKVLGKRGLTDQAQASYVVFLANEWLLDTAPQIFEAVEVTSLKDGTLYIESEHPLFSQELTQRSHDLLEHLNAFEGVSVSEVRIQRKK